MASEPVQTRSAIDYQSVLFGMSNGYVLYEIITDKNGLPADLRLLDMNPAFEALSGLRRTDAIGCRLLELLPETEDLWIKRCGRVALTGQPEDFTSYAVEFDCHLQVAAFCPKLGQVAMTLTDISEKVQSDEERTRQHCQIERVEAELNAIYQSAPVMLLVVDSSRRIVKINRTTLEVTGRSETEALGGRIGELLRCSTTDLGTACTYGASCETCLTANALFETLEFGYSCQGRHVTLMQQTSRGAEQRHYLLSSSLLPEDPSSRALICLVDITAFHQEQQLRLESESLYQTLIEHGDKGIFIHQAGKIVYANAQFGALVGCPTEKIAGIPFLNFIAPASRSRVESYIENRESGTYELNFQKLDGSVFPAEAFGACCRYRGKEARIVAVTDISRRKLAETELRASEQRYASLFRQFESLLDAIADPIALLTPERQLLWTNRAYEQVRHELGSDDQGLVFARHVPPGSDYPIQSCLLSGKMVETRVATPDERTWQIRAFPLQDDQGRVQQVIAVCIDVTKNLRLQKEALQSSRMASLGLLAAGVAHEINNPNALVLHNSDLLQTIFQDLQPHLEEALGERNDTEIAGFSWDELAGELPGLLRAMQGGAQRIKRIVDDLRDFARHEKHSGFEALDLNRVASTSAGLVENTLKKSRATFRVDLAANLPLIQGSPGRLEQVLINLLLNASQALDAPGQAVTLKTFYDDAADEVVAQVVDEGRGIAAEVLESLTEPFITTRKDAGGTGLGLSVAEGIVKEHGGALRFASTPGEGTCVSLRLPVCKEEYHG